MATEAMISKITEIITINNETNHRRHRYDNVDVTAEFIHLIPDELRTPSTQITARQCKACRFIDYVHIHGLNCVNLDKLPLKNKINPDVYNSQRVKYWYSAQHHEHAQTRIISHDIDGNEERQYFSICYRVETVCNDCHRQLMDDFGPFLMMIRANTPITHNEFKRVKQTLTNVLSDLETFEITLPYDGELEGSHEDQATMERVYSERSFDQVVKDKIDGLVIDGLYIRLSNNPNDVSEAYIERLTIEQYLSLQDE